MDALAILLNKALAAKYSNVATATLLAYDTIVNFGDEVTFIWSKTWNLGTLMYFISRYLSFVDVTTMLIYLFRDSLHPQACRTVYAVSSYFTLAGIILVEVILAIRTYALWKRSKAILFIVAALNVGVNIPDIIITHESISALTYSPSLVPKLVPCLPGVPKTKQFVPYINLMILEAIVTSLAVISAVNHWRNSSSSLIKTFYRDGILSFVTLLMISTVNVVIFSRQSLNVYYDLATTLQRVLHGILAARIIVNMRKAASESLSQGWFDNSLSVGRLHGSSSGSASLGNHDSNVDEEIDLYQVPKK